MNINDTPAPEKALEEAEGGKKRVLSVFRYETPQILSGSTELPPPPIQAIKNKYLDKKVCVNEMDF